MHMSYSEIKSLILQNKKSMKPKPRYIFNVTENVSFRNSPSLVFTWKVSPSVNYTKEK